MKKLTEEGLTTFSEAYAFPVCMALLRSKQEEEKLANDLEGKGRLFEIPDEYKLFENARMAHAVTTALSPEIRDIPEPDYSAPKVNLTTAKVDQSDIFSV